MEPLGQFTRTGSGSMEPLGQFTRTGSGSMESLDRFTRTGPGSGSSSGSMEPLDRFTRTGSDSIPRFLGPVHAVFSGGFTIPATFSGGFTVPWFGPVRNLSRTVPVPNPVPSGSAPVRFRVTRRWPSLYIYVCCGPL